MDLNRVKYLLRAYLRVRLAKARSFDPPRVGKRSQQAAD